jgi:hypothetical protein
MWANLLPAQAEILALTICQATSVSPKPIAAFDHGERAHRFSVAIAQRILHLRQHKWVIKGQDSLMIIA